MFLPIFATILVFCVSDTNSADSPVCSIGVQYEFRVCPSDEGLTVTPIKEISVNDEAECIYECLKHPDCKSVNVQFESALSTTRDCKLFTGHDGCSDSESNSGYGYKINSFTSSVTEARDVRGAAFIGDGNYILFFDVGMQKFRLTGQSLQAVEHPVLLTDYFIGWSGVPQAVVYSEAIIPSGALYLVKDGMVEQYLMTSTNAFPSMFSPWPQSIAQFFGDGVPNNINAAFAKGDKVYTCTPNNLYVSEYQDQYPTFNVVNVTAGYTSPKFSWSDVTAAAMDANTDVAILFTGNTYFLYDVTDSTTISSGPVCTHL